MRNKLKRDLLRSRTNYWLARHVVDGFLLAELVLCLIGFVGWIRLGVADLTAELPVALLVAIYLCAAVIVLSIAWLQREILHAIFDVADAHIEQSNPDPFKPD